MFDTGALGRHPQNGVGDAFDESRQVRMIGLECQQHFPQPSWGFVGGFGRRFVLVGETVDFVCDLTQ